MNRRSTLMTLLVISLVAGPFLFMVPSVYADKPDIEPVLIRVGGNLYDDGGNLWITPGLWFNIEIDKDPPAFPDPSWKAIGDIYDVTVIASKKDALLEILSEADEDGNYPGIEILLLLPNKYKNKPEGLYIVQYALFCDFDEDQKVTGHDTRIISNHMNNPGSYTWEYDLDQDGDIDPDDIQIADSYKGTGPQWITLEMPEDRIVIVDSNPYLITKLWHFSRFGRR